MANGLLDWLNTPAGQGLLAAGLGMAAGAGRGGPLNTIGRGGLMGLQAYTGAQDAQARVAEEGQQRELRTMQMDQMRNTLADEKLARETAARYLTPAKPGAGGVFDASLPPEFRTGGVPVPAQAARFDLQGYAQERMGQNPIKGIELMTAIQKDTPFGKIDPKDYTGESIARFSKSRDFADLVPVRKNEIAPNGQVYNPYGIQPGTVFADPNKPFSVGPNGPVPNTAFQQFEVRKAGAGAPRVNVNTDKSYFGNIAEGLAKNDVALIEAARSAPDRIASSQRVREVLTKNPITGTGAEARLSLNKALATAGLIDGTNVANTEVLASTLASQTLDAIKTSGLGGGQGFTDKDRQFLERAKSGNIEMTPQALAQIADLNERAARSAIKRGNSVIGKLRQSPQAGAMGQQLEPIEEPATAAPAGRAFAQMPTANTSNKGKFLTDSQTGKRFQSNGIQWVEVK